MTLRRCPDCVNYESNYSEDNNTLADQQAVIALLPVTPPLFVFVLIVMCADSWHFRAVLIVRIVWRQLEKTTCFECTTLTGVIDLHFCALLFPVLHSHPIFLFLSSFCSIHPTLNFSFHLLKLFSFFPNTA